MAAADGYWFPDYVADLDALVRRIAPGERGRPRRPQPRRQRRDASTPACGPARVRARRRRSTASAFPPRRPTRAPRKLREVARRAARSAGVRAVRRPRRGGRPPAEEQSAAAARQGASSSRRTGREKLPDGTRAAARRSAHKLPFPTVYRHGRRRTRSGGAITAPVLWIAADAIRTSRRGSRGGGERATAEMRAPLRAHPRRARSMTIADAGHMLHHDQPEAVARVDRSVPRAPMHARLRCIRGAAPTSRSSLLTLVWGFNWIAMKFALAARRIRSSFNVAARRGSRSSCCSPCCVVQRRAAAGRRSWIAIVVTGFFQTTINFGATTMALAGGGAGRTSVLVFTMPFWTLLIAWPVLRRARARQPVDGRRASRSPGSRWSSSRGTGTATSRRSCGRCCRASAGPRERVATKYFQRARRSTRSTSSRGRCSSACCRSRCCRSLLDVAADAVERARYVASAALRRRRLDGARLPAVARDPARCRPARRRSTCSRFP